MNEPNQSNQKPYLPYEENAQFSEKGCRTFFFLVLGFWTLLFIVTGIVLVMNNSGNP